jgi:hypothetical protein
MKKLIGIAALGLCLAGIGAAPASADPITCPPGQVATLNPSDGGWVCVNKGGNANPSEDPKSPNKDKGDFAH